jgi:hypothetical protein
MIAAYREPDRKHGRDLMTTLIESVSHAVPAALTELRRLGRTLTTRAGDVLAYFDRPGTSNGPTEAIIIWSPQRRVIDVAHGADRVRQRHVIWSMSLTRAGWIWLSLLAFSLTRSLPTRASWTCARRNCAGHTGVSRESSR